MESYIQIDGQYKSIIDGNIIDNAKWNMHYDGNNLDLEANTNDQALYMSLNNEEILKLFEIHSSNYSIHERLENDLHNNIQVQPIIMEDIQILKTKPKPKPKHHSRKTKSKIKHHSRKNKSKSKSKPKSKPKSTSRSKSIPLVI